MPACVKPDLSKGFKLVLFDIVDSGSGGIWGLALGSCVLPVTCFEELKMLIGIELGDGNCKCGLLLM